MLIAYNSWGPVIKSRRNLREERQGPGLGNNILTLEKVILGSALKGLEEGVPYWLLVRILSFHCRGLGLIPGQGTEMLQATRPKRKKVFLNRGYGLGGGGRGRGFPGGSVVKNLPANAGDTGSIPSLGRSHMPLATKRRAPQPLITITEAHGPRAHALQQEKPPQ